MLITEYVAPIVYSPIDQSKESLIFANMVTVDGDKHMQLFKAQVSENGTLISRATEPAENTWMLFESYDEAEHYFMTLDPEICEGFEKDRGLLFLMADEIEQSWENIQREEIEFILQREVLLNCCKRDGIHANAKHVDLTVGGIGFTVEKTCGTYLLSSQEYLGDGEMYPALKVPAKDMVDAIGFLPEYMLMPEVIGAESIRMRAKYE